LSKAAESGWSALSRAKSLIEQDCRRLAAIAFDHDSVASRWRRLVDQLARGSLDPQVDALPGTLGR
jgi:hypothetical protein